MTAMPRIPTADGAGSVDAALNNFVALHYAARHMSWLHCFWGVGATAGPMILSLQLSHGASWRSAYGLISGIQSALALALFLTLPVWRRAKAPAAESGEEQRDHRRACQADALADADEARRGDAAGGEAGDQPAERDCAVEHRCAHRRL